jgi:hypothetical protein
VDKTLHTDVAARAIDIVQRAWLAASDAVVLDRDIGLKKCIDEFLATNDASLMRSYLAQFQQTEYKSPISILGAAWLSNQWNEYMHVCEHAKMVDRSARCDDEYLAQCCLPEQLLQYGVPPIVKTVTIVVHTDSTTYSIVVTEFGDVKVDKETLRQISEATGISKNALMKHAHVNSTEFDPCARLGQQPGHAGPFPHFVDKVDCFVFRQLDKPSYVALRATPDDIICVNRRILQPLARAYLEKLGHRYVVI